MGVLAGCASEEDTIVMAPLPQVDSQFTTNTEWSTSVGDGVGHYFSKLSPIYANNMLFVASRDGIVKALDPLVTIVTFNNKGYRTFECGCTSRITVTRYH